MNDDQSPTSRAGSVLGCYRLQELLGSGPMCEVYVAANFTTNYLVAVKLMSAELSSDSAYRAQFDRANRLAAQLPGPHAVPIRDWGAITDLLYVEMELAQGNDLRRLLDTEGPLPAAAAVAAIEQLAIALDSAHMAGLVHGDVKPADVLSTRNGSWQLADFGLLPDGSGGVRGVPTYPAPERAHGFTASPRGDVYALACLFHEALTGSGLGVRSAGNFDAVIARGTASNPDERFATAGEFGRAARLELGRPSEPTLPVPMAEQRSQPMAAWPPPAAPQSPPIGYVDQHAGRSSWFLPVLIAVLIVALIALGGIVAWLLGGDGDGASTAPTTAAQTTARRPAPTPTPAVTPPPAPAVALPAGATPCPPVYGVTGVHSRSAAGNSVTSCPFAEEVRLAYAASGQAPQVVAASPVTGQSYSMSCTAPGRVVTCSGGNNAVVYLY